MTNRQYRDILYKRYVRTNINAGVAQLVEQLICNQQVRGSSPFTSSRSDLIGIAAAVPINLLKTEYVGVFPSGQRGQTVNLLRFASVVRIHPLPPSISYKKDIAAKNLDFIGVFATNG